MPILLRPIIFSQSKKDTCFKLSIHLFERKCINESYLNISRCISAIRKLLSVSASLRLMFSIYAHPCDGNRDRADLVGDSSCRVPLGGLADLEVALGARVRDEAGAAPAGN